MELTRNILLLLHLAGMAGILVSLLRSRTKISAGVTHSASLALIAGLGLVAIHCLQHGAEEIALGKRPLELHRVVDAAGARRIVP